MSTRCIVDRGALQSLALAVIVIDHDNVSIVLSLG